MSTRSYFFFGLVVLLTALNIGCSSRNRINFDKPISNPGDLTCTVSADKTVLQIDTSNSANSEVATLTVTGWIDGFPVETVVERVDQSSPGGFSTAFPTGAAENHSFTYKPSLVGNHDLIVRVVDTATGAKNGSCNISLIAEQQAGPPPIDCTLTTGTQNFTIIENNNKFYDADGNVIDGTDPFNVTLSVTQASSPLAFRYTDPPTVESGLEIVQLPGNGSSLSKVFKLRMIETQTHKFTVEAYHPDYPNIKDTCSMNFTLTSQPPSNFAANLKANGSSNRVEIPAGNPVELTWNVPNAVTCKVERTSPSGTTTDLGYSQIQHAVTTGNHSNNSAAVRTFTYKLTCEGFGQTDSNEVYVDVRPMPKPWISARLLPGGDWESDNLSVGYQGDYQVGWGNIYTNKIACSIFRNGVKQTFGGVSGSKNYTGQTADAVWRVECNDVEDLGATGSDEVSVDVADAPSAPTCTISVNKDLIELGQSVTATVQGFGNFHTLKIGGVVVSGNPGTRVLTPGSTGPKTVTGWAIGAGGSTNCTTNYQVDPKGAKWDFGGMYAYGSPSNYVNPVTGGMSCPSGYINKKVYGTTNRDYELRICYRAHIAGRNPARQFGGASGGYWTGSQNDFYVNPATGGKYNCPSGYSQEHALGTNTIDYSLKYCIRGGGTAPQHQFGGMFSLPDGGYNGYKNPITNTYGCEAGWSARKVMHSFHGAGDAKLFLCYKGAP